MTLVFAPVLGHGKEKSKLVSHTTTQVSVPCPSGLSCPKKARYNEKVNAVDDSQAAIAAATEASIAHAIADFEARRH